MGYCPSCGNNEFHTKTEKRPIRHYLSDANVGFANLFSDENADYPQKEVDVSKICTKCNRELKL